MLREMVQACFHQAGIVADPAAISAVESALRGQYGGRRIYIATEPKQRLREVADRAGDDAKVLAELVGCSERHARRFLRGK